MDWQCLLRGIMCSAWYIDALVPAAFPTSPSVPFPAFFHVPTPAPSCLRPQRALLTPCGPLLSAERYDAASEKNALSDRRLSFARRLGSIISSTVRACVDP